MKTSLEHLPSGKRRELEHVAHILRSSFDEAISTRKAPRLKDGRLLKIILFGSHARGDWVEDPIGRYFSDFDLLVVVDHEDLAEDEFWSGAVDRILEDTSSGEHLRTPVTFIVHSLSEVNEQLSLGRYFFADIVRDGVVLFDSAGAKFEKPGAIAAGVALTEAAAHFEKWFKDGEYSIERARNSLHDRKLNWAAFDFHQAAERFYHCTLLVLTLYSPKSHNIVFLRRRCEDLDARLAEAWPQEDKFQRRCFELLRAAYVKARYSPHYRITDAELTWLDTRIVVLRDLVKTVCDERLAELSRQSG
ncbi:HEPN domain-containing protein [Brevundimonas variabilis]|uniref:HEPN domain-containing protein/predicted nucleotidyltransferase n=1 Tax=Brevundimonas variabilis TaxID=74312 RepID=A0A7W9CJF6_9CAUL|nr:HEPN domain-containing protein [Brevundimonas variabilis]MBB5746571.1 HEPN domain-containing protein/predicted nucleotidyltransferase [Brevundimonas variabilis]